MLHSIRRTLRKLRIDRSGNTALLVALGMPALVGGAGLAVDTAQWYVWKRELQHAVDQSAMGAAWALSDHDARENYRTRAQQEFDANKSIIKTFVTSPTIDKADYAGGHDNSVIVTASATKKLPFSSFLTRRSVTVRARAQASFREGNVYNACLVALGNVTSALDIGGNATVQAHCGLAALSCQPDALVIDGSATVLTNSIATCGTANVPASLDGVTDEYVGGLEDIYRDLSPPDNPVARNYNCVTTGKGATRTTIASLLPGTYSGLVVSCTTVLASGIYVINGGVLDLTANYNVTGTNVMFVLKGGARVKFGGNGASNRVNLTPMVAANFAATPYAALADRYEGMLVFEARDNNPPNPGHTLNGNSNSLIEGVIYLPSGEMTVLGTADVAAQCLQISAYRLHISGNAHLNTLCPSNSTLSVGHSAAEVRLVA